jgi:hypothetical protein
MPLGWYVGCFDSPWIRIKTMKIRLSVLFLLCTFLWASAAFGQTGSISSHLQAYAFPDHPQHAEQHAMAPEHSLVGGGSDTYTYAQGERPLWEFGPVAKEPPTPLGDVARAVRQEKLAARKAQIVFEKQGS